MVKRAINAILFVAMTSLSWTGYRAVTAAPARAPQAAAVDPLSTEAAYRHRNALPNHWRGYVLQQRRF
jgi:hypothetical protein